MKSKLAFYLVLMCFIHPCIADSETSANPVVAVKTASVETKQWSENISAYGEIIPNPDKKTAVSASVDGIVKSASIYPGQLVSQGDTLLTLETGPAAHTQYQQAVAAESFARKQLDHFNLLMKEKLATRDQVAAAERDLTTAQSQLNALRKQGANNEVVVLRAPSDGIVIDILVQTGQIITQGTILVSLADRTSLMVRLGIEANDMLAISPQAEVKIETILGPSESASPTALAKIVSLSNMVNPQSRLVEVIALIDDQQQKFLLGQTVNGVFSTTPVAALVIPRDSLHYDGDQAYVFVVENEHAKRRDIVIGEETNSEIRIKSGLKQSEVVIVEGAIGVTDGVAVKVSSS
jgi:RND family efflux transporter MFP subunit